MNKYFYLIFGIVLIVIGGICHIISFNFKSMPGAFLVAVGAIFVGIFCGVDITKEAPK